MRKYKNAVTDCAENKKLYGIHSHMLNRCNNPECKRYADYGGRGITVCKEWEDFDTFADWAKSSGYQAGLTIDRIDNNGGYSPENCRWVTKRLQNRNKRTSRLVTYMGVTKPLVDWCEELGLKYDSIHNRIVKGWDPALAFNTPLATEKESFSSICRRYGINPSTVRDRIVKFGWTFEDAVSTPCHGRGKMPRILSDGYFGKANCKICGKEFVKHNFRQMYCGEKCRMISKRAKGHTV